MFYPEGKGKQVPSKCQYQSTRTHGVKCLKPVVCKDNNDKIKFGETLGISSPASLVTYVLFGRGAQTFQKFKSHLNILDARRVTLRKFHTEGLHKCEAPRRPGLRGLCAPALWLRPSVLSGTNVKGNHSLCSETSYDPIIIFHTDGQHVDKRFIQTCLCTELII